MAGFFFWNPAILAGTFVIICGFKHAFIIHKYGYLWLFMDIIYGYLWIFTNDHAIIYGYLWSLVKAIWIREIFGGFWRRSEVDITSTELARTSTLLEPATGHRSVVKTSGGLK